jgi:hypothetical protein
MIDHPIERKKLLTGRRAESPFAVARSKLRVVSSLIVPSFGSEPEAVKVKREERELEGDKRYDLYD